MMMLSAKKRGAFIIFTTVLPSCIYVRKKSTIKCLFVEELITFNTYLVLSTSEVGVIQARVRGSSLSEVTGPRGWACKPPAASWWWSPNIRPPATTSHKLQHFRGMHYCTKQDDKLKYYKKTMYLS